MEGLLKALLVLCFIATCNGSCSDLNLGNTGCCTLFDCQSSTDFCYCDVSCYTYNDCCPDITEIGCYPYETTKCNNTDIRLVGGSNANEGRVEVCANETWGTVCDDDWDNDDAAVVCRQLGVDGDSIARTSAYFGAGTGPINMNNVQCTGNEGLLVNCTYSSTHDCGHSEDAGVTCGATLQCNHSDIRLVGGSNDNEGRVEVCINGIWGTVCDDLWDNNDAAVVCNQLGIDGIAIARTNAYFGAGTGPINMDNVQCTGNEGFLVNCTYLSTHDCGHSEDAGVTCGVQPQCNNTDISLVGRSNDNEGRVEVCINGIWGTVCDGLWGSANAEVVCNQLGIDGIAIACTNAYFGAGTGPINMDNVRCIGNEGLLVNCTYRPNHNCFHSKDAGVTCGAPPECNNTDIRLVGGSNDNEGRVEVCINGAWGTVCDDFWSVSNARVVCRQLGFGSNGIPYSDAYYGFGNGLIVMDDVHCDETEEALVNCQHDTYHNCDHTEDAGVRCIVDCASSGSIRLVGGSNVTEGRVEVCINGAWGTVCDDDWGPPDAAVVCRQLGIDGGSIARTNAYFGAGTGPINMDNVQCTGNEEFLVNCTDSSTHNCDHSEDAGVTCGIQPSCNYSDIRLVGGSNTNEGRVEVCINGIWGTVCDDGWDNDDASVVCSQLGIDGIAVARTNAYFGAGTGPINMDNVQCTGNEGFLVNCTYLSTHNCGHFEDAGVTCGVQPDCNNTDIRLIGGSNANEGRVEVCVKETWGTVCDDDWDNDDAAVVCRQLGIDGGSTARTNAYFGAGTGPINMDNVQCTGNEGFLVNCTYSSIHNCAHYEDAGVTCIQTSCNHGDIRLVGGSNDNEGRVEVCVKEAWGTVCHGLWDNNDAAVVCNQLGIDGTAIAYTNAYFGAGTGPINMENVQCTGNEELLVNCTYRPNHNCFHSEDAGVTCGLQPECNNTNIRLVGGSNDNKGRVEVCINGTWGTVCDDGWDNDDAAVVCNQLGIDGGSIAYTEAYFGAGTGPINMVNLQCTGNEELLVSCRFSSNYYCSHSFDAGVACGPPCNHSDIRLVGGSNDNEGRVEVCINGFWGTVCDDSWSYFNARVVCRQLGLGSNGIPYSHAYYGSGTGLIAMDDVYCDGTEEALINCQHTSDHDCDHTEDAGVRCIINSDCASSGSIRLVGGSNDNEGRVEVCINGFWGTVCDDLWGAPDAIVVCNQLGIDGASIAHTNAYFGAGIGLINMDNVQCTGNEGFLVNCTYLSTHNCFHSEDAGVTCGATTQCNNSDIRLVGGSNDNEGRVEVCLFGSWSTVCDDSWGPSDAAVVCRQLGINGSSIAYPQAYFGAGTGPINMGNVQCTGTEELLINCGFSSNHYCSHSKDVGVACGVTPQCNNSDIRLVGGSNDNEGRVEVCINGFWGTVCDDGWDNDDAVVVCSQLGIDGIAVARTNSYFGAGTGPINMDNVQCTGNEGFLVNCTFSSIPYSCDHSEDAGVICDGAPQCNNSDIRLVGGSNDNEGRVEVCVNDHWGTVCSSTWTVYEASLVCKQLGINGVSVPRSRIYFSSNTDNSDVSVYLFCTGNEVNFTQCETHLIYHSLCVLFHNDNYNVGVSCGSPLKCKDTDIRLVGGSNDNEGRVEVCINGTWGTVCDDDWDNDDAVVVCNQLGIDGIAIAHTNAYFGAGTGPINMDNVQCTGNEGFLVNCTYLSTHDCGHFEDAGVTCGVQPECNNTDICLVGGSNANEGRVEVCINGAWGTVCDDDWDSDDAAVVCRQLGLGTNGVSYGSAFYGQGNGSIVMDEVNCIGTEKSLFQCAYTQIHDCSHHEDAGVKCVVSESSSSSISVTVSQTSTILNTASPSSTPIQGSCLSLNLPYTGCCNLSYSPACSSNGCYCDAICYLFGDCCGDIEDIGCILKPSFSNSATSSDLFLSSMITTSKQSSTNAIIKTSVLGSSSTDVPSASTSFSTLSTPSDLFLSSMITTSKQSSTNAIIKTSVIGF
ncbi:PREDICTED: LOW QUALITY PROTEIN: deleted in malignant brain tumors 1 protein-like [Amphimedon queenslandica]|uniref:Deleted in malignant brain tumors 1 protein n=1 Tax=Amphimedon queenslandica TaxID=400682 RepID=A0AAN0JIS5_AMPQE|nr:PREDICTED: LOW QUALITY PROTEIN: deleted in malignant brain tumors 1 protein-like [Amphimedon queenslandica]|eukprot:XP_019856578.1 PREDICTED: LOW QUALITY PROTEIN: deleted in malignant brain tumors 1 protein-like [Amphimedon queenslandica]